MKEILDFKYSLSVSLAYYSNYTNYSVNKIQIASSKNLQKIKCYKLKFWAGNLCFKAY